MITLLTSRLSLCRKTNASSRPCRSRLRGPDGIPIRSVWFSADLGSPGHPTSTLPRQDERAKPCQPPLSDALHPLQLVNGSIGPTLDDPFRESRPDSG